MNVEIPKLLIIEEKRSNELKTQMLENTILFIKQLGCEDVEDIKWKCNSEAAVEQITIIFEHPINLTRRK